MQSEKTFPRPLLLCRVLWTDYLSLYLLVCILAFWVCAAVLQALDFNTSGVQRWLDIRVAKVWVLGLAVAGTCCVLPIVFLRAVRICRILLSGVPTPGRLLKVRFHWDHGVVEFAYSHDREHRVKRTLVHRTKRSSRLRARREVDVRVNPEKPDQAVIWELYLDEIEE